MRTSIGRIVGLLSLAVFTSCTVKSVEAPPFAGPSTFAKDLNLAASPDVLTQNGVSESTISIAAKDPNGNGIALSFRAEIRVNGATQDYGSISNKTPRTDSSGRTTFTYRVPAAPPAGVFPTAQRVTIAVTPESTDYGVEYTRTVDIQLLPQGVIGNNTLVPSFTVVPAAPLAYDTATLDASTTTNRGSACLTACAYAWDFGDGTTGSGLITTHQFRSSGSKVVTLAVVDAAGFRASTFQTIAVGAAAPPTPLFTVSPTGGVSVGQDVFFNATASKPAPGRTITGYSWAFGDGDSASGVTTSHRYRASGSYLPVLTVTDEVGGTAQLAGSAITVTLGTPVAALTFLPASPKPGQTVVFDAGTSTAAAGSTIVSYTFTYGDGSPAESGAIAQQSHVYGAVGSFVATVTVTDSQGRTNAKTANVVVVP
ncbi:MAG: PKD domain-containing protein [Vicinamibacterales bacterium]